MICDRDLIHNYDGIFSELEEAFSYNYDVEVSCKCGNIFKIYVDTPYRCRNCGRVYQLKSTLMIGDKIVSDEEFDQLNELERQKDIELKLLLKKYSEKKYGN
jgi:hypothetical protein